MKNELHTTIHTWVDKNGKKHVVKEVHRWDGQLVKRTEKICKQ